MKKMFRERNSFVIGLVFIVATTVTILAALNVESIIAVQGRQYSAIVPEAAGLKTGDAVRVSGVEVGRVTGVELAEKGVRVTFSVTDGHVSLNSESLAAIKVATILGDKELEIESRGDEPLQEGATIPLERSSSPYDVSQALSDLTTEASELDTQLVAEALDTVSTTLEGAPPELREAMRGVQRLSSTFNSRDQEILDLASHADQFSAVLADRSEQLTRLVEDGNLLFQELAFREDAIRQLLRNVSPLARELTGLVRDNEGEIGPALDQLNKVIEILRQNRTNVKAALSNLSDYATTLGEAVGSGRMFTAKIQNLLPGNLVPSTPEGLLDLLLGPLKVPASSEKGGARP